MSVLDDILLVNRLRTAALCHDRFRAPWGLRFADEDRASFHVVVEGRCWVLRAGQPDLPLGRGDILFDTRGTAHVLQSDPWVPATEVAAYRGAQVVGRHPHGAECLVLSGSFYFEHQSANPLFPLLPEHMLLRTDPTARATPLQKLVDLLVLESGAKDPGQGRVTVSLLDTLFVYVLREWSRRNPNDAAGLVSALAHPRLSRALTEIHKAPARAWTTNQLSSAAGLSRASLTRVFGDHLGVPPMEYLARWRMDLAARDLRDSDKPLSAIAVDVGYGSDAAFGRSFRRYRGEPPGQYRARHRQKVPATA